MGSAGLGGVWALLSLQLRVFLKAPCWHLRTRRTRLEPPSTFALAVPFRCQKHPILCPCGSCPLHLTRFPSTRLSLSGIPINHKLHEGKNCVFLVYAKPAASTWQKDERKGRREQKCHRPSERMQGRNGADSSATGWKDGKHLAIWAADPRVPVHLPPLVLCSDSTATHCCRALNPGQFSKCPASKVRLVV